MVNAMVHPENFTAPQDKQKWLLNRITDGVKKVTLDLSTFVGGANESKYFASIDDENTVAYLYSGIPLARINNTNNFGPYDPTAKDGRQNKVAGFLESQVKVEFTRKGLKEQYVDSGLRYMAVIDKGELPVAINGAKVDGLILSYDVSAGSDVEHCVRFVERFEERRYFRLTAVLNNYFPTRPLWRVFLYRKAFLWLW